jgi:serine/threonine-protein kinase
MTEETTKRIGDYEILGVLGSGGMGKVYKVRNVISDRVEAMKILLPDLAGRQDLADRFLREIKVLAALNHPNIASLRTALTLNNQLVMVMEYVEGTTLADRLEHNPIAMPDAVNYIDQVLGALSYAHRQHVIHRDIKPANMMLTPEGVVKLMDFGIARSGTERSLTATGTTLGSLYYMSPEQVKGQATDERSDLYSVGVSLYEMVTGQRPFQADSDYSLMAAHLQQPPKPPVELRSDLPAALNEIILMAIAKDPAQRFQSADAFRNALSSVKGSLPAAVPAKAAPVPQVAPVGGVPTASIPSIHDASTASMEIPAQPPQPIPSVLELSAQHPSHRGLYMTLGAVIVLAVLVVAGIYIPRRTGTSANEPTRGIPEPKPASNSGDSATSSNPSDAPKTAGADSTAVYPQNPDAANLPQNPPNPPVPGETQPAANQLGMASGTASPGSKADSKAAEQVLPAADLQVQKKHTASNNSKNSAPGGQSNQATDGSQNSQVPAASSASGELDDLEQQADQLSSQVSSVNESLDNLRRQQNAQGLGLRGDIASAQELMKTHMAKAQSAIQNRDAASAKKYLDLTEQDVAKLDKFLGR